MFYSHYLFLPRPDLRGRCIAFEHPYLFSLSFYLQSLSLTNYYLSHLRAFHDFCFCPDAVCFPLIYHHLHLLECYWVFAVYAYFQIFSFCLPLTYLWKVLVWPLVFQEVGNLDQLYPMELLKVQYPWL